MPEFDPIDFAAVLYHNLGFKAGWSMQTGMVDYLNRVCHHAGLPPIVNPS